MAETKDEANQRPNENFILFFKRELIKKEYLPAFFLFVLVLSHIFFLAADYFAVTRFSLCYSTWRVSFRGNEKTIGDQSGNCCFFRVVMETDCLSWDMAHSLCLIYISMLTSCVSFFFFCHPVCLATREHEIKGAPTRCFGCRSSPSGDADGVAAHTVVAAIGFDGVVVDALVTSTTAAGAAKSSADDVGGGRRHGSAGQRDEPIVFQRRRPTSAVSPIRT